MALGLSGDGTLTGVDPVASGFGKVLQVVQTFKDDPFSTTSTSMTDVTGMSVSITPSETTSKVLIVCTGGVSSSPAASPIVGLRVLRDSTPIGVGAAAGSRTQGFANIRVDNYYNMQNFTFLYLDSPNTTLSTTYKLQMKTSSGTSYLNRTGADDDAAGILRTSSTLLAIEVAA